MRQIIIFISILILFVGCQKKQINVHSQLTPKIIVNGYISDQLETQTFELFYSSNINDIIKPPILNADIEFEQLGTTYQFIGNGSGRYSSSIPFSCVNDETFSVKYNIDTSFLQMNFLMPKAISITNLSIDSSNYYLTFSINVYTPIHQYATLKTYEFITDSTTSDSLWIENTLENSIPIYEIKPGQNILQYKANEYYTSLDTGKIIKFEAIAISNQTAKYFLNLKNYYETVATSSLYVNPPRFYTNHFYGITYGLSTTSISDTL